jgi:transcription antitermination factor NusG
MSTIPQLTSFGAPFVGVPAEEHWYAVYTRSRHEKAAAALLQQKGVTTFLPLVSRVHRWSDRRKTVQVSLFPGYTFVRVIPTAETYLRVMETAGVVGFVGVGRHGIPIPDKQIEDVQTLLTQNISCAISPFLRVGQRVRIRGGCLDGIEGLLVAFKGDRSLVISIDSIFQSVAIRIEGYDIEILSSGDSVIQDALTRTEDRLAEASPPPRVPAT